LLSHAKETALPSDHALAEKLRQTAKLFHVTAAVGMAERGSDAFWSTQLVCGADGTLGVYRKTHLGSREKAVFSAGDALPVFHDPIPFGIGICYDMHFPEAAAAMRAQGATLIVSPHAAPVKAGQRSEVWMKYMPARAYDNRVFVACCNMCGTTAAERNFRAVRPCMRLTDGCRCRFFGGGRDAHFGVEPHAF
jgi:predicted amidohydrolase